MVLLIDAAAVCVHHERKVLRGAAERKKIFSQLLTDNDLTPVCVLIIYTQKMA